MNMNIQQMMQQAQQMQVKMRELQAKLAEKEIQADSGGGMVKVTMTCKGEVRKLEISPEIISADEKETLEDLVLAAMNNARAVADKTMADDTRALMQEMGLPADGDISGMPGI